MAKIRLLYLLGVIGYGLLAIPLIMIMGVYKAQLLSISSITPMLILIAYVTLPVYILLAREKKN
jgi:hypothetical protein